MQCRQWNRKLYDFVDGTLPVPEAAAMQAHIENCAACRERWRDETKFAAMMEEAGRRFFLHPSRTGKEVVCSRFSALLRPIYGLAALLLLILLGRILFHSPRISPETDDELLAQAYSQIESDPLDEWRRPRPQTLIINKIKGTFVLTADGHPQGNGIPKPLGSLRHIDKKNNI